jgi:hypothetical protein
MREAAGVSIVIALALPGTAMSQQHSQVIDTGVIFSAQQLERSADAVMMGITPPYWTPSPEEVARLEGQLKLYLEDMTAPHPKAVAAEHGNYKRQYLGYTRRGKKWIYVNSVCKTSWKEGRWHDELIIVFDGGPCFFSVRYDLSSSQFDQLSINGPERF